MFRFAAIIAFLSLLTTSLPVKIHAQEADEYGRQLKLFLLRHSDAAEVADKLRILMDVKKSDNRMVVMPDKRQHSLLVRAWPQHMNEIENVIDVMDRPGETRVVRDMDIVLQDDRDESTEARRQRQLQRALLGRQAASQTGGRQRDRQRRGERSRRGARGNRGESTRDHDRGRRHRGTAKDGDRSRSRRGPRHARGRDERGRNRRTARRRTGSDSRRGEHPRFSRRSDAGRGDRRNVQRDDIPRGMMARKPSIHTGKDGSLDGRLAKLEQRLERLEDGIKEAGSKWDQRLKRIENALKKRR